MATRRGRGAPHGDAVPTPGSIAEIAVGAIWFLAVVAFVAAAVLLVRRLPAWRVAALIGAVSSTVVIGLHPGPAVPDWWWTAWSSSRDAALAAHQHVHLPDDSPLAHPSHLHVWPFTVLAISDDTPPVEVPQDVVLTRPAAAGSGCASRRRSHGARPNPVGRPPLRTAGQHLTVPPRQAGGQGPRCRRGRAKPT